MSSRQRRRRGNAKQKLQKQLEIQRELERELQKLNSGKDQNTSAKAIIDCVQNNGKDPMLDPENPFHIQPDGCCQIL